MKKWWLLLLFSLIPGIIYPASAAADVKERASQVDSQLAAVTVAIVNKNYEEFFRVYNKLTDAQRVLALNSFFLLVKPQEVSVICVQSLCVAVKALHDKDDLKGSLLKQLSISNEWKQALTKENQAFGKLFEARQASDLCSDAEDGIEEIDEEIDTEVHADDPWKNLHPYEIAQQLVEQYKKQFPDRPDSVVDDIWRMARDKPQYFFPVTIAVFMLMDEHENSRFGRGGRIWMDCERRLTNMTRRGAIDREQDLRIRGVIAAHKNVREFAFKKAIEAHYDGTHYSRGSKAKALEPYLAQALIPIVMRYAEYPLGISTEQLLAQPELSRDLCRESSHGILYSFDRCMITEVSPIPVQGAGISDSMKSHIPLRELIQIIEEYLAPDAHFTFEFNLLEGINLDNLPPNTTGVNLSVNPLVALRSTKLQPLLTMLALGATVLAEFPAHILKTAQNLNHLGLMDCDDIEEIPEDLELRLPHLTSLGLWSHKLSKTSKEKNKQLQKLLEVRAKEKEERDKQKVVTHREQ